MLKARNRRRANLGDELEDLLIMSCEMYRRQGLAVIRKVPTPLKIIGTTAGGVLLAVPEEKSTVDYMGTWRGRSVAFEAKQTSNPTSYRLDPWKREDHQREFLNQWERDGGIAGHVIYFKKLSEFYYLRWAEYRRWQVKMQAGGRKSIPIKWFREHAERIQTKAVPLDFLAAIEAAESNK